MICEILRHKEEIIDWLRGQRIDNYTLIKDERYGFMVNSREDIHISELKVKFNLIEGHFNCSSANLTSLEHGPNFVTKNYLCRNNRLTNLKGGPERVGGNFDCSFNQLVDLRGSPEVWGNFICSNNQLVSLEGVSGFIDGLNCSFNNVENLLGLPKELEASLNCSDNRLKSLEGCPLYIGGDLILTNNKLDNLNYIAEHISQNLCLKKCPINIKNKSFPSHVGGVIKVGESNLWPNTQTFNLEEFKAYLEKEILNNQILERKNAAVIKL